MSKIVINYIYLPPQINNSKAGLDRINNNGNALKNNLKLFQKITLVSLVRIYFLLSPSDLQSLER